MLFLNRSSLFLAILLAGLLTPSSLQATTINYSFATSGFFQSLEFNSLNGGHELFVNTAGFPTTGTVVYNPDTNQAEVIIEGMASVGRIDPNNGIPIPGMLLASGTDITLNMTFENVTKLDSPDGVFGLEASGASSSGRVNIANIGDVFGNGSANSLSYPVVSEFRNFSGSSTGILGEIASVGSANLFLINSQVENDLIGLFWFQHAPGFATLNNSRRDPFFASSMGNATLSGVATNSSSAVPEPSTSLLLLLGLLFWIYRNNYSKKPGF